MAVHCATVSWPPQGSVAEFARLDIADTGLVFTDVHRVVVVKDEGGELHRHAPINVDREDLHSCVHSVVIFVEADPIVCFVGTLRVLVFDAQQGCLDGLERVSTSPALLGSLDLSLVVEAAGTLCGGEESQAKK